MCWMVVLPITHECMQCDAPKAFVFSEGALVDARFARIAPRHPHQGMSSRWRQRRTRLIWIVMLYMSWLMIRVVGTGVEDDHSIEWAVQHLLGYTIQHCALKSKKNYYHYVACQMSSWYDIEVSDIPKREKKLRIEHRAQDECTLILGVAWLPTYGQFREV